MALLLGGIIYYVSGKSNDSGGIATTTPVVVNNGTTGGSTIIKSAAPVVVTSSSVSPTDTTAIVNGNVNPKGALTSYWYEYGTTVELGSKTINQTIGSGFVSTQAPGYITNLVKNTTYYYRLVAENQNGRVTGSQYSFKTTVGTPAPVGSAPTVKTIQASGVSRTTANINGEVTPNKNTTQYWFEYGKTPELGNTSAFSSAGDGTAKIAASISLSDLDPATTYYFRLNAQNQFGTVNGSILNFKTTGPTSAKAPAVTTGSADTLTSSTAVLHGTVTPNLAATNYWFEYSTDSLLDSVLLQSTETVAVGEGANPIPIDKSISGLNPKTTYYFRIVAENSQGTVRGDKVTFKTK